ncbi:24263_t:CDS:2, partial [Entrophospora sp. SA101]
MGFYSCPHTYIDDRICGKGCYRPEGCHIHWKMRPRIPCDECGMPTASSYGISENENDESESETIVFELDELKKWIESQSRNKECKAKDKSFLATLPQLFAMALYSFCGYLWLSSPNSYILKNQHFILFTMTAGVVFGRIATKIILSHLTKIPFPMYTVLLIPLFLGAILTNCPRFFGT